jgi:GNAT superfamily N-acetyltransferase
MNIRLAAESDIESLIKMRLDFTLEHNTALSITENIYEEYYREIKEFLVEAISSDKWFMWVAEEDELIVSHIFLELINKVPRPGRKTNPFVYMTNVYTLPDYRGHGIGSRLLQRIEEWSRQNKFEFIIVWPSDEGIAFYRKNKYAPSTEPMELMLE